VRLVARAPGKVNLCLLLGPVRDDGRHEVATLIESVSMADELELVASDAGGDEVMSPGVSGPNIVSAALAGLRARGWDAPPVRVTIDKRIPVAAGMGGGSADAAAVLRMAPLVARTGLPEAALAELAAELGTDVPSALEPGLVLGTGAGELIERCRPLAPHAFVIVPQAHFLPTADVYREADGLGLPRGAADFSSSATALSAKAVSAKALSSSAGGGLPPELIVNDLAPAAITLCPPVADALRAVSEAGADHALVCGSGPTVAGLFWGEDGSERAGSAAAELARRYPRTTSAVPVGEEFGAPVRK
jgi:4-diphosphocytidyl-2-C-methyl-D-erythritol kinase